MSYPSDASTGAWKHSGFGVSDFLWFLVNQEGRWLEKAKKQIFPYSFWKENGPVSVWILVQWGPYWTSDF